MANKNIDKIKQNVSDNITFSSLRSNKNLDKQAKAKNTSKSLKTENTYMRVSDGLLEDSNFNSLSCDSQMLLIRMYKISIQKHMITKDSEDLKRVQMARSIYSQYNFTPTKFSKCVKELEEHKFIKKQIEIKARNVADTYKFLDKWWNGYKPTENKKKSNIEIYNEKKQIKN